MQHLSTQRHSKLLSILAKHGGMARTYDLLHAGVHPRELYAARDDGTLFEVTRGIFRFAELELSEPDLVAVASRMPRAVFGLTTALHIHGLTQEIPRAVHILLSHGTHPARLEYTPLEVYHILPELLNEGVEVRVIDGIEVRVTTPARSVADAFKFRRRISLESAIDALKQTLISRAATPSDIDKMATMNRVQNIIRPYLEALA